MGQSMLDTVLYEEYVYRKDGKNHLSRMQEAAKRKRSDLQRCPICNAYESIITNVHCMKNHGMTKKEVEADYGKIMTDAQRHKLENQKKASEQK